MAWADGRVADEEHQVIDALLAAYDATPSEAREIHKFADTARTIDEIELNDLSASDRRVLLQHAVLLTFIDGEQHEKEKQLLSDLVDKLRIPSAEAQRILAAAEERARTMLKQL